MELNAQLTYERPPADVFAMLTDPDYVRARAEATAGQDVAVDVADRDGTVEVTCARSVPADVPDYARAMVGESIRITERITWGPEASGHREGTFEATFAGVPVVVRGRLRLAPDGAGAALSFEGQVKASVPIVGRKVEQLVHDQVAAALVVEQELGTSWLAD